MRGRPSTYRPEYARHARTLGPVGMTDAARFFAVSRPAIVNWLRNEPEFRESLTLVARKPGPHQRKPIKPMKAKALDVLFSAPWRARAE